MRHALLLLLILASPCCFRAHQEARQVDAAAYLHFTGNPDGGLATLESEGARIWVDQPIEPRIRYTVKPGVYRLTVSKDGAVVADRKIFLGDQQVFEVRVP